MRVLLIRAKYHSVWEPLNLMYLAGYVKTYFKKEPLELAIRDEYFSDLQTVVNEGANSDIVGITGTTPQLNQMLTLAKLIKTENKLVRTVVGGFGPTLEPEKCLESNYIDQIVLGEGEQAFLEILNGRTDRMVNCSPIPDISNLPLPDRETIKLEQYISLAKKEEGRRVTSVLSNRGCPYSCTFCVEGEYGGIWGSAKVTSNSYFWQSKRKLRARTAKSVVDELVQVRDKFNIEFFKFSDAELNYNKQSVIDLCKELVSRNWETPWGANFRVDKIDDEVCKWLVKAHCTETWFGVESGSPKILQDTKKGISVEMIKSAFALTKRHGLIRRAYFLLGTPSENFETIKDTERLIDDIDPYIVSFSILAPYPGTSYWNPKYSEVDWSNVDEYSNNIWSSNYLSNEQLRTEQKRLMDKYSEKLAFIVRKKKSLGII